MFEGFYGSQIGFHVWKQCKVSADVWELQKFGNQKLFEKNTYLTKLINKFTYLFVQKILLNGCHLPDNLFRVLGNNEKYIMSFHQMYVDP